MTTSPRAAHDARPLLLVWGNCQAESLRLLLDASDVRTVRLPAVHELMPGEVDALHRLVAGAELFVSQPVAAGYHGLPVGTAELVERLPPTARHVVVPNVRYAGLYPGHVVAHPPELRDPTPPLVPYHDLWTATAAAWTAAGRRVPAEATPGLDAAGVRAVAGLSLAELRRREAALDVRIADVLERPVFACMRTVDHPGNRVLVPLAERVRSALGLEARASGVTRPLLASVRAPREPAVAAVFDPQATARDSWCVEGQVVPAGEVARAHAHFYAARPDVLVVVLRRFARERGLLGLRTPPECA